MSEELFLVASLFAQIFVNCFDHIFRHLSWNWEYNRVYHTVRAFLNESCGLTEVLVSKVIDYVVASMDHCTAVSAKAAEVDSWNTLVREWNRVTGVYFLSNVGREAKLFGEVFYIAAEGFICHNSSPVSAQNRTCNVNVDHQLDIFEFFFMCFYISFGTEQTALFGTVPAEG